MHACHPNEYGDYKYDKYKVSIVNECVMAENEPITPIIFAQEQLRASEAPGGREGGGGKDLPAAERAVDLSRERSSRRECYILSPPSSDTWDVTRERINRLWSVQMQLPDLAALFPPLPPRPLVVILVAARNRIKSKAIIGRRL